MDNVKYITKLISGEDLYYLKDTEARTNLIDKTEKGVAGGVATLDNSGKVPSSQLPESYVSVSKLTVGETEYNPIDGNITIPAYPTTLPASDVSAWAKSDTKPSYTKSEIGLDNVTNDAQVKRSEMGVAEGVATLDTAGKIPSSQLPSYVDDVLEYTDKSSFPATGETGKIYVDTSTNLSWRWGGTTYVEISPSLALGETSSTAYAGDKGKALADKLAGIESGAQVHRAPTAAEVKSALGTGSGTSKYLREDGSWQTPPDNNTTYSAGSGLSLSGTTFSLSLTKELVTTALGYTPPTADTNTWRPLGTGANDACAGNDSRLSNAREPYFANGKWYAVGDDSAIGDHNVGGTLCVKGLNGTPGINLYNSDDSFHSSVITSANIGSQSVNYANGAGNADTLDGYHYNNLPYLTSHQDISGKVDKVSGARPGVTKLYRSDSDDPYNVQTTWTGSYWLLRGFYNDNYHAGCQVAYADYAGSAGSAPASDVYAWAKASSKPGYSWGEISGKPFNWDGQSGQPSWLWGSNDGTNYYVWNPSNFNVNHANSANSAGSANYANSARRADYADSAGAISGVQFLSGTMTVHSDGSHSVAYLPMTVENAEKVLSFQFWTSNGINSDYAWRYFTGLYRDDVTAMPVGYVNKTISTYGVNISNSWIVEMYGCPNPGTVYYKIITR